MLVQRIFSWKARRDRFMTGEDRGWVKRAAFQPTKSLDAAFRLLAAVKPVDYELRRSGTGPCTAKVTLKAAAGAATSPSMPLAICLALARSLNIEVETID
jgi:hypothetical protein